MSIQEYRAEETVLLNAQNIKQRRGIQQTLYFTRLDLNKKTAIVISEVSPSLFLPFISY